MSRKIQHEETASVDGVADLLAGLTDALRARRLRVARGGEQMTLVPGAAVSLAFSARSKGSRESVCIELVWQRGDLRIAGTAAEPMEEAGDESDEVEPRDEGPRHRAMDAPESHARNGNDRGGEVEDPFEGATKAELRQIAAEHGIELPGRATRDDLVTLLSEHQRMAEDCSRDELYQRARELGIEGRSRMSKDELVEAVRQAEEA